MLPILHLNGYKIASPTVLARISHEELGSNAARVRLDGHISSRAPTRMTMHAGHGSTTLDLVIEATSGASSRRRVRAVSADRPRWPMIVLAGQRMDRPAGSGWTQVDGTWRARLGPMAEPHGNSVHVRQLEGWLQSYRPAEFFESSRQLRPEGGGSRHRATSVGANPHANGGRLLRDLGLPDFRDYGVAWQVRAPRRPKIRGDRRFLHDVGGAESRDAEFPALQSGRDRLEPARQSVFEVTEPGSVRRVSTPQMITSHRTGKSWRCSHEHQCQGWLEGYLLTGRHGFFSCYEAFIHIVDSMVNQHAKWLKVRATSRGGDRSPRSITSCPPTSGGRITMGSATRIPASSITS